MSYFINKVKILSTFLSLFSLFETKYPFRAFLDLKFLLDESVEECLGSNVLKGLLGVLPVLNMSSKERFRPLIDFSRYLRAF